MGNSHDGVCPISVWELRGCVGIFLINMYVWKMGMLSCDVWASKRGFLSVMCLYGLLLSDVIHRQTLSIVTCSIYHLIETATTMSFNVFISCDKLPTVTLFQLIGKKGLFLCTGRKWDKGLRKVFCPPRCARNSFSGFVHFPPVA